MTATATAKFTHPDRETIRAMVAHALEEFPKESCGVLVDGKYQRCKNVHIQPEKAFRLDAAQWAELVTSNAVQAVIHSHPKGPQWPSAADMEDQIACGLTYGIVPCREDRAGEVFFFGDDVPREPFLGRNARGFRHGVTDCYSLIRDWYMIERGIRLPEVPRDWGWWNAQHGPGLNLYLDVYSGAGFKSMGRHAAPQHGDIILIQSVESPTVNHAGIYLKGDLLLHHTCKVGFDPSKLPEREPVSRQGQFVKDVIRYQGAIP